MNRIDIAGNALIDRAGLGGPNLQNRAYFQSLQRLMLAEFGEEIQELAPLYKQNVRLKEKLELIEECHAEFRLGRKDKVYPLLKRIQNEFPETGSYYYFEAEVYRFALEGKIAEEIKLFMPSGLTTGRGLTGSPRADLNPIRSSRLPDVRI